MKTVLLSLFALVFATTATVNAATAFGKKAKVTIETSGQCGACEARMTTALEAVDGVKAIKFSSPSKVTVTYDDAKTNPDALREAITALGYDADDKKGNHAAYHKLPACCQKGGHSH